MTGVTEYHEHAVTRFIPGGILEDDIAWIGQPKLRVPHNHRRTAHKHQIHRGDKTENRSSFVLEDLYIRTRRDGRLLGRRQTTSECR